MAEFLFWSNEADPTGAEVLKKKYPRKTRKHEKSLFILIFREI